MMLAVLGFILSGILHLLLGILLFVLAILMMVLFVPIRYWFDGHRLEEEDRCGMQGRLVFRIDHRDGNL